MRLTEDVLKEAGKAAGSVRENGFAVIPGETGWALVADTGNSPLLEYVFNNNDFILPVVLLQNEGQFVKYFPSLPEVVYDYAEFSERPLYVTSDVILNNPLSGIRTGHDIYFTVVKNDFLKAVTGKLNRPLVLASLGTSSRPAVPFMALNKEGYVVNLRTNNSIETQGPVIIKILSDGSFKFIRK